MTLYQRKSFTVPASGEGKREDCAHGWRSVIRGRLRCVPCGLEIVTAEPVPDTTFGHPWGITEINTYCGEGE